MQERGKFIQIATTSVFDGREMITAIHALDANGEVWEFKRASSASAKSKWVPLASDERGAPPQFSF